jgi:ribosomal-protein-alanine N-acetyltransferase
MVRLETKRLVVRHGLLTDVGSIVRYLRENREFLQPWEPLHAEPYYTEAFWRIRLPLDLREYAQDRSLRLFLFPRESAGEVAGVANFTNVVRGSFQACYLGYALGEKFVGRGFMTEALQAALDHVFTVMKLHRVMANHLPENARSAAVLRRLDFQVEGQARDYLLIGGRWRDHVLNSKVAWDWQPNSDAAMLVSEVESRPLSPTRPSGEGGP